METTYNVAGAQETTTRKQYPEPTELQGPHSLRKKKQNRGTPSENDQDRGH